MRRWGAALALVAFLAAFVAMSLAAKQGGNLVYAAILLPLAWVVSPLFFPRRTPYAVARRHPERVTIFFRPGCVFCVRLRLGLRNIARKAQWVDIWADPDAAAHVRDLNRGDELVPTVVVGEEVRRNPDPQWVGAHLVKTPR
ncbi:glutaredoxin family protein [Mariniluteicoccus flavus]